MTDYTDASDRYDEYHAALSRKRISLIAAGLDPDEVEQGAAAYRRACSVLASVAHHEELKQQHYTDHVLWENL